MTHWYWLASYPKSGNTWFRAFLANLRRDDEEPVHINEMGGTPIASSRHFFETHLPLETASLSHDDIDAMRPDVYRAEAAEVGEGGPILSKVHDAYHRNRDGDRIFPSDVTLGALHIVRNPLDVCPSYANHNFCTVEQSLRMMNNPRHALCPAVDRPVNQVRQTMGSWSDHAQSWMEPDFPVHRIRYEDMKHNSLETFQGAAKFLGLPHDDDIVAAALEACKFERLQAQEQQAAEDGGFKEKMKKTPAFFRKGLVGAWRGDMSLNQAARLCRAHEDMMGKLGYEIPDDVRVAMDALPPIPAQQQAPSPAPAPATMVEVA